MNADFEELEKRVRALSPKEKAELARILIEDLDADVDQDAERLWLELMHRRCEGWGRASESVARANFYPCQQKAGYHIPYTRKALDPNPGYQRAPSLRTIASGQPADAAGTLTFNSHDAALCAVATCNA